MNHIKSICFVIPGWVTKQTGGAEWQCYLLSEEFVKNGWEVEVFTAYSSIIKQENYYNNFLKYHYYKSSKIKLINLVLYFLKSFKTNSKNFYLRTDEKTLRTAFTWLAKFRNIKIIYAIAHDDEARNVSFNKSFKNKNKKGVKYLFHFLDSVLADIFTKKSIYNIHKIISQTSLQKKILKCSTGLNSVIIRNSLKLYQTDIDTEKSNIILWVGNMRSFKRPDLFLRLIDELKIDDWKFVMIGKPYNYEKLIDCAKHSNFLYLGELSYEETNKWFEKANILVNTSTAEGFSNTFLQAWYYKVLVVSLNVNPDNLLTDTKLGVFANGNFQQLKVKILQITKDFSNNNSAILEAEKFVRRQFELKYNYDKLIQELIHN